MIPLLLAAVAAPQSPARLHPEHVVFYAELPDMQRVLDAYSETAGARLIADPDVRAAFAELLDSVEYDVASLQAQLATETGVPLEALQHPVATLKSYLTRIASLSFSASLDESRTGEFAETIVRMHTAVEELGSLQDAIYLYAVDHDGRYPETLEAAGVGEAEATDPWGRPYAYAVLPDASGFDLHGLGADGAPGGAGRDSDLSATTDLHALLVYELEARAGLTLTVALGDPADAAAMMALLRELAGKAGLSPAAGYQPAASSDVELTWFTGGPWDTRGDDGPGLWAMRTGSLLALGAGSSDPEAMLERAAGKRSTALDSPGHAQLARRFGEREDVTLGAAFVELSDLIAALQRLDPVEGVNWGMLAPYATSTWRTAIEPGGRFVTESYALPPGEGNQLGQCIGHDPVPEGIWRFLPAESVALYASSIDAPRLYDTILEVVQSDLPSEHASALSRLEEKYGFSLRDDLFGSIGSSAGGYMLPISGLMAIPGLALVAKLDDPERFQRGLEGLLRFLEDEAGGEFEIKYRPYREAPLWYFSFQGTPIPISPSLVIVDDHLLLTLSSTRAKKEVKRIQAEAEGQAEEPESHAVRALVPADATQVGFIDWARMFAGAYDGGKAALALMGGGLELPFDSTLLPESDLLTRYHGPSIYWTRVTDDGVYSHGESSFGPETLLGIGGLAAAGSATARMMQSGQVVVVTEVETEWTELSPQSEAGGPVASKDETRQTMRLLATRLAVYKLENGRYPARLDVLLEPTESYPRGFLDGHELPLDSWQNAFSYAVGDDGETYRLWSRGPDGLDQSGQGDDLVN